eukprot:COSAG06_NODE_3118_length_5830_cov_5.051649_1_plen_307_part_10
MAQQPALAAMAAMAAAMAAAAAAVTVTASGWPRDVATPAGRDRQPAEAEPPEAEADRETREQLHSMKIMALRKRALSMGADEEAVDDAVDAGKARVIALITQHATASAAHGSAKRIAASLASGGEKSAELIVGVLETAIERVEQLALSSPRKTRRSLVAVSERAESALAVVGAEWGDGAARCSRDSAGLEHLANAIVAVQKVLASTSATDSDPETARAVLAELLDRLEQCGGADEDTLQVDLQRLDDDVSELMCELRGLRLMVLSRRALSMGVDNESVEEAMDADDAKSAVIALIVEIESRRGPVDR